MTGARNAPPQPAAGGGSMSDRENGTDDGELCPSEVYEFAHELERTRHFTRWLAIVDLENQGKHPINSRTVMEYLAGITDDIPDQTSIITSMRRLKSLGAIKKEDNDDGPGYHWTSTEYGRQIGRQITMQWCKVLRCPEAADALRACGEADSADSDEGVAAEE